MKETNYSYSVADGAKIVGDVSINHDSSIWYNAVLRGDESPISVGHHTNIQDNAVVHTDHDSPVTIGDFVTIGHGAIIHGCSIGDNTLIGMGAIVLNDAKIGNNCIIGAGALVTQNTVIPDNSVAFGSPAKVLRSIKEDEIEKNRQNALSYVEHAKSL